MSAVLEFALACAITWAGGEAAAAAIPLRGADFGVYLKRRTFRLLWRLAALVAVVGVGLALRRGPGAIVGGAAVGWLLAAGREALAERRATRGTN